MTQPGRFTIEELRDRLITVADEFGSLMGGRARLEHLAALLFLKRAGDVDAEERRAARKELGNISDDEVEAIVAANPDAYHQLRIPAEARWDAVRKTDQKDLGSKLDESLRAIAAANPRYLKNVFDTTDFNNRQTLPVVNLAGVVSEIQELGSVTTKRVSPELLGRAFVGVVDHFSHLEKPAKGEMFTPSPVARLGAQLLRPDPGIHVHDPACGSSGLLLHVRDEVRRLHGDGADARPVLFGQERKPSIWLIARMNAMFHGAAQAARIEPGDTVLAPAFADRTGKFDLAICNPPFALETNDWYEQVKKAGDKYGRIKHLPPKGHPELVFVQHAVASLKPSGRMAVLLPNGALFRARAEQAVRKDLLEDDLIEAIIQLPKGMFYGSGIPIAYVVLNKAKPEDRADKVLFIDASERFERIDTFNVLRDEDSELIETTFREGTETEGFSAWVERDVIRERRYNLTVRRYVRPADDETDVIALDDALDELDAARAEVQAADEALVPVLAALRESPAE